MERDCRLARTTSLSNVGWCCVVKYKLKVVNAPKNCDELVKRKESTKCPCKLHCSFRLYFSIIENAKSYELGLKCEKAENSFNNGALYCVA